MAKSAKKSSNLRSLSFWLIFIGSLIFLFLSFAGSSELLTNSTGIWQPLLFAGAILGSLILFMMNFGNLGGAGHIFTSSILKVTIATTFGLVALSLGTWEVNSNIVPFILTVTGFVLTFIGSSAAYLL
jgi:hypothetical protein